MVSAGLYYIYKMQFDTVYGIYPLIGFLLLTVVNLYIIIRDIIKINTLDGMGSLFTQIRNRYLRICVNTS